MAPSVAVMTDRVPTLTCRNCNCIIDVSELEPFIKVECPDCGEISAVPARLGHFLLLDLLGMGGMGGVYYAKDETLGRFVAIKVMLKSLGDDPQFIETFKREAQAVAKLNHPHIAQIYSFGQEKGQPYIVMELVSGNRLDAMMEAGAPLDQGLLMRVGLEIAEGLRAADEAGLVHGDIKPENILLDRKGQSKLVDFGLASASHQTNDGGIWGTPYYIAPEKVRRQTVDARADIYSLGATLFHALAGRPPFEGDTLVEVVKARLEAPPPPLREYRPDIDEDVARIIERMLEEDLSRRYPTYNSLISDLRRVVEKLGAATASATPRAKTIRLARKRVGSSSISGPAPEATTNDGTGGRNSRIVIRKAGGGRKTIASQHTGTIAPPPPTPEEIAARERARRARRNRVLGTFAFLLVAGATAAGGAYVYMQRQQEAAARRQWFAYAELIGTTTNAYTDITSGIARVAKLAAAGPARLKLLEEHVLAVTGAELEIPQLAAPRPPEPPAATNAAAGAAGTEEAAAPADDAATNATNTTAGADVPTEPAARAEPDADAERANSAPVTGVDAEPPLPDGPPILVAALEAGRAVRMIARRSEEAAKLSEPALIAYNQALQCSSISELQPLGTTLQDLLTQLKTIDDEVAMLDKSARTGIGKVSALREAFDRAEKLRIENAAAEAERLRKLELEAEAERQRQQKVDAELVETAIMTNAVLIQLNQNAFAEAVKAVDQKLRTFETQEGKTALKVVRDRYQMLEDLRQFLIRRINEDPFGWGWAQGTSPRDISKADPQGLYVLGTPQPVPWASVSAQQMLKMVDHYLVHPNTRASERGTQTLAAAIYCYEHGGNGVALSKRYFDKALDLRVDSKEAGRLLPFGW